MMSNASCSCLLQYITISPWCSTVAITESQTTLTTLRLTNDPTRQRLFIEAFVDILLGFRDRRLHQTGGLAHFNNRAHAFDVDPAAWGEAESGTDAVLATLLAPVPITLVVGQQTFDQLFSILSVLSPIR